MEAANCQGYEAQYTNYHTKKAKAEHDMQRKTDTKKAKAAALAAAKNTAAEADKQRKKETNKVEKIAIALA